MSEYDAEPLPEPEPVANEVEANEVEANEVEEEPAPVEAEEPEPVEEESVSTQEVVQNVQEMLTTEPAVSSDSASLEERVKVLEERLEKLINTFMNDNITPIHPTMYTKLNEL